VAADTGTWSREPDFDGNKDVTKGSQVPITDGSTSAGVVYRISTNNPITIDTTSIAFELASISDLSGSTFIQSGTGAVSQNSQTKMRERFSVVDFDAKFDGSTDDVAAFQAAHDALPAAGGEILLPEGTTRVSSAINITKPMTITGQGQGSTIILTTSATAKIFNVTGEEVLIRNLQFGSAIARTGGAYVHFDSTANRGTIKDFLMLSYFIGVQITAEATIRIKDGSIRTGVTNAGGSGIFIDGGNDHYIDNITMDAAAGSQPAAGIRVTNSGSTNITNCGIIHHTHDLLINPQDGQTVASLYAINTFFDTAERGIFIDPGGTGVVTRCHFIGCWTSSHSDQGVLINSGGTGERSGIEFIGHHSVLNTGIGFHLLKGTDIRIVGGAFNQNEQGIAVAADVDEFSIVGAQAGAGFGVNGNSNWGIIVAAGTSDNYTITNNDVRGNTSGGISDGGSGTTKIIRDNLGHATETSGTATIANGGTSIVVTHNLAITPTVEDISVVMAENPTNDPGNVWVDTITATQFTINCRSDPGASNLDFGWQATIL